ncbi:hypothetical protein ABIC03_007065 [Bradyrhizobium sp. RT6a]|uniref:hypothetical protein n=1 Tax=Bradyrhizobium sp. RT6a TaxID=3156381 RepID=UPI003391623F
MRIRLTTFAHVASAMGKIMVKEAFTGTDSDHARSGYDGTILARIALAINSDYQ